MPDFERTMVRVELNRRTNPAGATLPYQVRLEDGNVFAQCSTERASLAIREVINDAIFLTNNCEGRMPADSSDSVQVEAALIQRLRTSVEMLVAASK